MLGPAKDIGLTNRYGSVVLGSGESPAVFELGRTYALLDRGWDRMLMIARDALRLGMEVLLISGARPDMDKERWQGRPPDRLWIGRAKGKDGVPPDRLPSLLRRVASFAEAGRGRVILLDGIECLSLSNGIRRIQMFMEDLNDIVMGSGSILFVALEPRLFDPRSLARLLRYAEIAT